MTTIGPGEGQVKAEVEEPGREQPREELREDDAPQPVGDRQRGEGRGQIRGIEKGGYLAGLLLEHRLAPEHGRGRRPRRLAPYASNCRDSGLPGLSGPSGARSRS